MFSNKTTTDYCRTYPSKIIGQKDIEDGSSSTETLSAEERHTLTHTQREEPQGEEQVYAHSVSSINVPSIINTGMSHFSGDPDSSSNVSTVSTSRNNDCNLSMSSNNNTLIIHHSVPDESWSHRWLSGYTSSSKSLRECSLPLPSGDSMPRFGTRTAGKLSESIGPNTSYLGGGSIILNSSSFLDSGAPNLAASKASYFPPSSCPPGQPSSSHYSNPTEILDIPSAYLDQSEVLKHLITKETKDPSGGIASSTGGSPCGVFMNGVNAMMGGCSDQSASSSSSVLNALHINRSSVSGSSSQGSQQMSGIDRDDPDLSALLSRLPPPPAYPVWQLECSSDVKDATEGDAQSDKALLLSKSQPDLTRVGALKESTPSKETSSTRFSSVLLQDEDNPSALKEYIDILSHENSALKLEVDIYHRKVAKLQRFELEMAKVEEQYEALVKLCERREQLERLARHKLHSEVRRLTEQNCELKDQLESRGISQSLANQSANSESCSEGLLALKKELSKRDVLIAQLVSQNKELVATKERQEMELTAQRQTLNEQRTHIDILDSALTNAQTNVVKLEEEVRKKQNLVEQSGQLKRLLLSIKLAADRREQSEKNLRQKLELEILQLRSNTKVDQSANEIAELRRDLREKDEKIMILEGEVTKREQRFFQESALRQVALETSISKNRGLDSQNTEREAMIRALQKRTEEKDTFFQTTHNLPGASNISESTTLCQSSVEGCPTHQHSTSGVSTLSVFATPPRKDEELGPNTSLLNPFLSYCPSLSPYSSNYFIENASKTAQDAHAKSLQEVHAKLHLHPESHTRSESYCCYINSYEQDDGFHSSETYPDVVSVNHKEGRNVDDGVGSPVKKHVIAQPHPSDLWQSFRSNQCKGIPGSSCPSTSGGLLNPRTQPTNGASKSPSPSVSKNVIEIQTSRGNPPPYYSHHQVLMPSPADPPVSSALISQSPHHPPMPPPPSLPSHSQEHSCPPMQLPVQTICSPPTISHHPTTLSSPVPPSKSPPLPRPVAVCHRPHPPTVFCRTCLNVRRSHRQNAAALVRRANSSGCQHNRRSAPSPASSADSLDDAPSILERLKKEWEMGVLGPPISKKDSPHQGSDLPQTKQPPPPTCETRPNADPTPEGEDTLEIQENESSESGVKKDVAHLDRALNRLSIKRGSAPIHHARHITKSINPDPSGDSLKPYSNQESYARTISQHELPSTEATPSVPPVRVSTTIDTSVQTPPYHQLERNVSNQVQGANLQPQQYNHNDHQCIELMILEDTDQQKKSPDNGSNHNPKVS